MLKKFILCCLLFALGGVSLSTSEAQSSAKLTASQTTTVPGSTLQPGAYTLQIVDHLSDRYILRVDGGGVPSRPTFLGIPSAALKGPNGAIKWAKSPNDSVYMKGWNFGGAAGPLEFVYPKDDAVALAKANGTRVAAIDPASEGRVTNNGLSKEDMQMVTLWLLSPTHVGAGDPSGGIKAERYQQVAKVEHMPVVARLPHTASFVPLIALLGILSLGSAWVCRSVYSDGSRLGGR